MFETIYISEYKVGSKLQFYMNILLHCKKQDLPTLLLLSYVEDLEEVVKECQAIFKSLTKSQLTALLQLLDGNRDRLIRGVILLCKGKELHWDEAIAKAATRCLEEIDKYGKEIYNLSYSQETVTVTALCDDFLKTDELKGYSDLLGIKEYFEHIESENNSFAETFALRQQQKSEKVPVKLVDLLALAHEKYIRLQDMIFSFSNVNGQEPYQALINVINSTIVEYNQLESTPKRPKAI